MPSSLHRNAHRIHRYEGLPFLATDASGIEYVLTPIFVSGDPEKTFHLRDLFGCTFRESLFVECDRVVPWGQIGRYVLTSADGRKTPLRSDDYLAP